MEKRRSGEAERRISGKRSGRGVDVHEARRHPALVLAEAWFLRPPSCAGPCPASPLPGAATLRADLDNVPQKSSVSA